ncbi:MAG TPA: hypothetical protein VLA64_08515 [Azonexus sp.]|nr:hypothetical protein [Azonexus sp.]
MTSKKPSPTPSTATKALTQPVARKTTTPAAPANPRQQPDNRWQRSKRYGWDSR